MCSMLLHLSDERQADTHEEREDCDERGREVRVGSTLPLRRRGCPRLSMGDDRGVLELSQGEVTDVRVCLVNYL